MPGAVAGTVFYYDKESGRYLNAGTCGLALATVMRSHGWFVSEKEWRHLADRAKWPWRVNCLCGRIFRWLGLHNLRAGSLERTLLHMYSQMYRDVIVQQKANLKKKRQLRGLRAWRHNNRSTAHFSEVNPGECIFCHKQAIAVTSSTTGCCDAARANGARPCAQPPAQSGERESMNSRIQQIAARTGADVAQIMADVLCDEKTDDVGTAWNAVPQDDRNRIVDHLVKRQQAFANAIVDEVFKSVKASCADSGVATGAYMTEGAYWDEPAAEVKETLS